MIYDILNMNGYGFYVWGAFLFTMFNFTILYFVVKAQLTREKKKFNKKFAELSFKKTKLASKQGSLKELIQSSI
tara:strand:- start:665 stop:886 length:222 start_codon:yes stop_codon:yes gene_type:complete